MFAQASRFVNLKLRSLGIRKVPVEAWIAGDFCRTGSVNWDRGRGEIGGDHA